MAAGSIIGAIIGVALATLVSGLLILVVGKLGLGMEVDGAGTAFLTGFVIALLWLFTNVVWRLLGYAPDQGFGGAITHLILTAGFLYAIRNSISGLQVKGFGGAILAAAAIAALNWLVSFGLAGAVGA